MTSLKGPLFLFHSQGSTLLYRFLGLFSNCRAQFLDWLVPTTFRSFVEKKNKLHFAESLVQYEKESITVLVSHLQLAFLSTLMDLLMGVLETGTEQREEEKRETAVSQFQLIYTQQQYPYTKDCWCGQTMSVTCLLCHL